ncbi:hypothetical protein ACFVVU_20560 [Kitasatospora sp. NPDC057965]|uniref:hypothetical protein n=1 Tax=Kitasatospora sp. NPDC057965 TaxID=3346291 RepID=UPI0036DC9755
MLDARRMRIATRLAIAVPVLGLTVVVWLVVSSGRLLGEGGDQCSGQDARLTALDKLDALALKPSGSQEVEESANAAECVGDDSVGSWLSSSRVYSYGGSQRDLIGFYEGELAGLGWRREGRDAGPGDVRTCFTRKSELGWETLTITFRPGGEAGATFRATAEAAVDRSKIGC